MVIGTRGWALPVLAAMSVIFSVAAPAATVELKDGGILKGVLDCGADGACVLTRSGGQTIPLRRDDIKRIDAAPVVPPLCAGCGTETVNPSPDLRVSGSNTIGSRLMPALLIDYAKRAGASATPAVPRASGADQFRIEPAPAVAGLWREIEVQAHGSTSGFQALAALAVSRGGEAAGAAALTDFARQPAAQIAMASRRIKTNELDLLASLGRLDDPDSEQVLALDGLAVIVNRSNPIEALTRDQIRQIFSGEITDWGQVGGRPGPINRLARSDGSGTLDIFRDLVLQGRPLAPATRIEDSAELADAVTRDPAAIGFVGMSFQRQAKALAINECGLSYPPTSFNVKSEEYPLSRRLYLYVPADSPRSVHDFIAYTRTDAAQRVVAENEAVDLGVEPDATASQAALRSVLFARPDQVAAGDRLARLMQGAQRLSLTLRFRSNSGTIDNVDLDSRAIRDLVRLADYMRGPQGRGRHLTLLGYTDSDGNADYNRRLSRDRALSIKRQLEAKGIAIADSDVIGFGPDLPVACNDSEAGKARNRRVEVWISR